MLYIRHRTGGPFGRRIHPAGEDAHKAVMLPHEKDAASGGRPAGIISFSQIHPFGRWNVLQSAKRRGPHARRVAALFGYEDYPPPILREVSQVKVVTGVRKDGLMLGRTGIPGYNRAVYGNAGPQHPLATA